MFFSSKHLDEMNMNYFEHMLVSINYAFILFLSSIKAFIHAFIPDIFTTSTSECIQEINVKLNHNNIIKNIIS